MKLFLFLCFAPLLLGQTYRASLRGVVRESITVTSESPFLENATASVASRHQGGRAIDALRKRVLPERVIRRMISCFGGRTWPLEGVVAGDLCSRTLVKTKRLIRSVVP